MVVSLLISVTLGLLLFISNPLTMSLILVILSLEISVMLGSESSSWLTLILILLYSGGMMIIFIYASSIVISFSNKTSNSGYNFNPPIFIFCVLMAGVATDSLMSINITSLFTSLCVTEISWILGFMLMVLIVSMSLISKTRGSMKTTV